MKSHLINHLATVIIAASCLFPAASWIHADEATSPCGLILTWQGDPTTTITIDWHRLADESATPSIIQARPRGSEEWGNFSADRRNFPHSDRLIDRVEIKGLQPATEYEFRGGPTTKTYWFRTMPATLQKPLVFASGGDVRHNREFMEATNRAAMRHDPEFIVWGGDLAYADGDPKKIKNWYEFLDIMVQTLVTDGGRVPPVLVCAGNHEVRGAYHNDRIKTAADREKYAPFFYGLFAFPGHPGYGAVDFGDYLSLVFNDTDHTAPIAGAQTSWLRKALTDRRHVPHLIPIYHVPAYPSVRKFETKQSALIREHWVPLFEQNQIRFTFEHHDHSYKRTVPIFQGKANPEKGIVYIGDGAWGVGTRQVHSVENTWYLDQAESIRHALIVTVQPEKTDIRIIDSNNQELDILSFPARN